MTERRTQKRTLRASVSRKKLHLSPREAEVLGLMSSERVYGSKALAARLKISPRQARRLIQKLRDKGCLDRADAQIGRAHV